MDLSGFQNIAPYLEDPLVLSGFALFLFFGALRFVVKRLPIVTRKIAGIAVLRLVTFGFVLALAVIVTGFGVKFMEVQSDAARLAAEHRAQLAEQAIDALQSQLKRRTRDLQTAQDQSKALTEAVTALAKNKGPGIDAALKALSNKDTAKAKAIFRRITEKQAPNVREAAAAFRHLGALAFLDDTQQALAAYRRATELDPKNASGWNQLGILYRRIGRLDEAISAYRKVRELGEASNDESWLAIAFGNLGNVYTTRGDLDKAVTMYNKALVLNQALGRKQGMANNYTSLGVVYQTRGQLDKAETMYKKALDLNQALGRNQGVAYAYNNLGVVYRTRGELDKAVAMHNKALLLDQALGHKQGMANNYNNLGNVYGIRGELDKAVAMHNKALVLNQALGHKQGMASNYANLGIVYQTRSQLDKAEEAWRKSLKLFREIGSPNAERVQGWLDELKKSANK